ncbi:acetoacetate--CoA ligase [Dyadobacter sediminis]|uniref:Acetoacetate--CoA ligase n=1 Tax=Dyadobacter sediminis TaxID=1493691 RepID=A0A5R9K602_9BACT|nr:acetoacetate--CoA ligase [Dyadobacter sediminis]TLU89074.1 acetoacetate--CoA ligase [Dyadobacter sediminis]GGC02995.1 acetoacetyl-CoA synthetase [Dyadobacter sediminis]
MSVEVKEQPLWKPGRNLQEQSNLKRYMDWLFVKKGLYFRSYHDLWDWSVTDLEDFWESLWHYFNIKSHDLYLEVLQRPQSGMIGTKWFTRSKLNYAEHIFRNKTKDRPAIVFQSEQSALKEISWDTLEAEVAAVAAWLRQRGVKPGDRVAAVVPNIPQSVTAFLAVNSIGAVWSSCSPDFGKAAIMDRFLQIEPKVLFIADGYSYNGKTYDITSFAQDLSFSLPSVRDTVLISNIDSETKPERFTSWEDILHLQNFGIDFEPVPFDHPIWILYSSGTTAQPKAITHSVGGCLLEHFKALILHQNVKPGDRYFWYSTTGWMMWNYALGSLLCGATLVLYDGAPAYPSSQVLWTLAEKAKITHFGSGASYFINSMKSGVSIASERLNKLETIGSTGSPLPAEVYEWIYRQVKKDVWLISLSGGTDVCSAFVGGCPILPVYAGEIQCRMLGCRIEAYDENGKPVQNELGEMVITRPMPSMPVYFWNDEDDERYYSSYFEMYPNVWRHGDWIRITSRQSVIIHGRSDATLNRGGVRIGTAEIYRAVESIADVKDSLAVYLEKESGGGTISLFVVLGKDKTLTEKLKQQIKEVLRSQYSPRHVPDTIEQVNDIPYTMNGKKIEAPMKRILMGEDPLKCINMDTVRNPESLKAFV